MGDSRHKKPPPDEVEEENTPEFRAAARAALTNNASANRIRGKKKGDPGYLISNQAELADEVDADRTTGVKSAARVRAERDMAIGLPLIRAKDPRAYRKLIRLLARLSADVARQRQTK